MAGLDHIEEVLKLIEETGDRCVVLQEGHDPFVVMDLASYRSLLSAAAKKDELSTLTERELLDRINQQIAEWREARQDELSEYDLTQFRIDRSQPPFQKPSPVPQTKPQQASYNPVPIPPNRQVGPTGNLPVVADGDEAEYHLEPLA